MALKWGIFSGRLQFTAYKGTNLLRQEAIAKTEQPSVAYNYRAGLRQIPHRQRATRDVARCGALGWQKYEFGGSPNEIPSRCARATG